MFRWRNYALRQKLSIIEQKNTAMPRLVAALLLLAFLVLCCAPGRDLRLIQIPEATGWKTQRITASPQSVGGDAAAGWNYILYGDMLGAGMPLALLEKRLSPDPNRELPREGLNRNIPTGYTVFTATNGVPVMNGNCFSCHAGYSEGRLIPGLGNIYSPYQKSIRIPAWGMKRLVEKRYKPGAPEREAFGHFGDYYKGIAPYIQTNNPGTTPAFRLEEACVRWRDPVDLRYRDTPNFDMLDFTLPTDVPPLWNIQKKNALYYNGMGRGDFRKLLMQAIVLAAPDSSSARQVFRHFDDVLAWTRSLTPPPYPYALDPEQVAAGQRIFSEHCQTCHGRYESDSTSYPSKLIALSEVGTDPYYAIYMKDHSGLPGWYNSSWFAVSEPSSSLEPEYGYMAPPLDGIWATAPYLHNASVPTLEDLLNSRQRPTRWEWVNGSREYDQQKGGWKYESRKSGSRKAVYDTTRSGYGNQGHRYGDVLSDAERRALIAYLQSI
jgi:hypothetical protein